LSWRLGTSVVVLSFILTSVISLSWQAFEEDL
jgi:hypothetical protein